jgi:hypothetical protein
VGGCVCDGGRSQADDTHAVRPELDRQALSHRLDRRTGGAEAEIPGPRTGTRPSRESGSFPTDAPSAVWGTQAFDHEAIHSFNALTTTELEGVVAYRDGDTQVFSYTDEGFGLPWLGGR